MLYKGLLLACLADYTIGAVLIAAIAAATYFTLISFLG